MLYCIERQESLSYCVDGISWAWAIAQETIASLREVALEDVAQGAIASGGERRVHLVVAVRCTMLLLDVVATILGQCIGSGSFASVAML